jgi:hypothetical protein
MKRKFENRSGARCFILLTVVFLLLSVCQTSSAQQKFYGIAGSWSSNWGEIIFKHDPNPANIELISITGDWYMGAGKSTFSGTYNPKTLEANFSYEMPWRPEDDKSGTVSLKFNATENSLTGKYYEKTGSGEIKGQRK